MDRMKELIIKLNLASRDYYNHDQEKISNYEYDNLYDELLNLERETGIIFADSPTQKIGTEYIKNLKKVNHETRMLSLDKTKNIFELEEFLGNKLGILSYKLDGITVILKYENKFLKQIATRGNGDIGEDVTHNFRVFKNLPRKINLDLKITIRGEAVISYKNFEEINNMSECFYKNPRSLVSGTVRNLDASKILNREVNFIAFELIANNNIYDFKNSKQNKLELLKKLGFEIIDYKITCKKNLRNNILEFKSRIKNYKFASDGLVLTFDDISYSNSLGVTSKFPKDSLAFKWEDKLCETKLLQIEWNTSRTGLINPVAIFEPVELDGSKIQKANLHNISFIEKLKLGIGDKIKIYKANMIIPQIAENLTQSNTCEILTKCPTCLEPAELKIINTSKFLFCVNKNCRAKLIMSLTHFASRDAMNIKGLSQSIIKKLVEYKFINNYFDIYNLEQYEQEIKFYKILASRAPNKKHLSYNNLIHAINLSRENIFLYNFIYALGINHVGLRNAKILCQVFNNNIQNIINAKIHELEKIYSFSQKISESIKNYFLDKNNLDLIYKTLPLLKFRDHAKNILSGMNIAITGKLINFNNKQELENLIKSHGGEISKSITKNTKILINNNPESKSSKHIKALKLNILIMNEHDFLNKYLI